MCVRVCVCVCVFLFGIDRANRLTNDKTSVVAGKVCVCVRACVRASVASTVQAG